MPSSTHFLDAVVDVTTLIGEEHQLNINGIRCIWQWDQMTREAAELWAIIDYVADTFNFTTFSVVSYTSTSALEV